MKKFFKIEGKVVKTITFYVEAENADEAWKKGNRGELVREVEGEVEDVDLERASVGEVKAIDIPRRRPWNEK